MTRIYSYLGRLALVCLVALGLFETSAASAKPPLKALFVTGGGYHDYAKLAPFLTTNLSQLINVTFDVAYNMDPLKSDKFADGYDVIVYDVCFDEADPALLENALKVARAGKPSVMIHCAVHAFRKSDKVHEWENFCGMRSKVHDPYQSFTTEKLDPENPITKAWPENWTTLGDELYQTIEFIEGSHPLLRAKSPKDGREHIVCWIHTYGKGRVFATTLGHDFKTAESPDYLHLLSNGILWSCDKLKNDGTAKSGYGVPAK
jgi:type 1 glutamine amidotransferase